MNPSAGTVFVLDDNAAMVRALTRLLKADGFVVHGFTSSIPFFECYQQAGPACLVLDLNMPEIDGFSVMQRIRDAGTVMPIVFLSGDTDERLKARSAAAGTTLLAKPVNDVELLASVRAALSQSAPQRADSASG